VALTVYELARALPRLIAGRRRARRWIWLKIGIGVWVHNFFTMAVARDLYEGTPAVYVNYLDYDEAAHAFGPRSPAALRALRAVDRSIERLWGVMRRVPEHRYDAYILADHGQSNCTPFHEVQRGKRLERWIFEQFLHPRVATTAEPARSGLRRGVRQRRRETIALLQKFMNYTDEDYYRQQDPEAHEQEGMRAIAAGPNAFLYALDATAPLDADALERRFPGLPEKLSSSPGIGFVLARSGDAARPLCFWRGQRLELSESQPGPFAGRADAALVVQGIVGLMQMPSAGDLVIYGTDAPGGTVSFIREHGGHAGPSETEMQTFIVRPAQVSLPAAIIHPVHLYDHFIGYQADMPAVSGWRTA
jgi:hypothetical protein